MADVATNGKKQEEDDEQVNSDWKQFLLDQICVVNLTKHHDAHVDQSVGEDGVDGAMLGVRKQNHKGHRKTNNQKNVRNQKIYHSVRYRPEI